METSLSTNRAKHERRSVGSFGSLEDDYDNDGNSDKEKIAKALQRLGHEESIGNHQCRPALTAKEK